MKNSELDTFEKVCEWVRKNVHNVRESVEDSTVWFFCVQEARFIHEANRIKDTAQVFLDGVSSYRDHAKENADAWLGIFQDDPDGTYIEDQLKDHFRVKTGETIQGPPTPDSIAGEMEGV